MDFVTSTAAIDCMNEQTVDDSSFLLINDLMMDLCKWSVVWMYEYNVLNVCQTPVWLPDVVVLANRGPKKQINKQTIEWNFERDIIHLSEI